MSSGTSIAEIAALVGDPARENILFALMDGRALTAGELAFAGRVARQKRCFCRICIDWTERRPHVAGAVGAAFAKRCFELKWTERIKDSRAVRVTQAGRQGFASLLGLDPLRLELAAAPAAPRAPL